MSEPGRQLRVLLVDQSATLRLFLAGVLTTRGYSVESGGCNYEPDGTNFEVAVINLDGTYTPERGPLEIAATIRARSPTTRIIVLSRAESELDSAFEQIHTLTGNPYVALLKRLEELRPKRRCLVIMPFSGRTAGDDWSRLFNDVIKEAVLSTGRYECELSDPAAGDVLGYLIPRLIEADVVIAVLAGDNPNVYYELGLRHAEGGPTVLLVRETPPATVRQNAYIQYVSDDAGFAKLYGQIKDRLEAIAENEEAYISFASQRIAELRRARTAAKGVKSPE